MLPGLENFLGLAESSKKSRRRVTLKRAYEGQERVERTSTCPRDVPQRLLEASPLFQGCFLALNFPYVALQSRLTEERHETRLDGKRQT